MHEREIEHCKTVARRCMDKDGHCEPVFVCYEEDGKGCHFPLAGFFQNKDAVSGLLDTVVDRFPTVVMVCEAWLALLTPEQQAAAAKGVFPRASEHPQRTEVVMVSVYQKAVEQHYYAPIVREGKQAHLGEWVDITPLAQQGRFCKIQERQLGKISEN